MADDQPAAHDAIGLKRSARDPEHVRQVLVGWLGPRLGADGTPSISPLSSPGGGVANETFLFDATWTAQGRERTDGFVVRVATERPLFLDSDIETHYRCYEALADVPDVPVPEVVGFEPDTELLGGAFFVMERVEGDIPRDFPSWTEEGFLVDAEPARRRAMWESAVEVLAALHRVDPAQFPFLGSANGASGLGADLAYWRRFLDHGQDGEPIDQLEVTCEWLIAHAPTPAPTGFAWGDARFCNLVFRDDRVAAVLDWDQVSLAGPETDLAWWRAIDPTSSRPLEGIGNGDELVRRWEELSGRAARDLGWHDLYAQFRLAVVMVNLFRNMGLAGQLPPDVARQQSREANPMLPRLAEQLRDLGG